MMARLRLLRAEFLVHAVPDLVGCMVRETCHASQQFYLGGLAFGRGYGSAEISGDNGVAGTVELRFDQKSSYQDLNGYQLYGFVDAGLAWNDGYRPSDGLHSP